MWSVSNVTCVDIIAQVSLTQWEGSICIFRFVNPETWDY